jgi:tryptophan halogenase
MPNLPAFSEISAFRGGWLGLFPMQHRTAVLAVYDTDAIRDQELAQQLALMARMPIQDDAIVSDLRRGIRTRPWIGNCVAIGEAAIALDPLGALDLHVAHACISHLITLFPASSRSFIEAEVYNRTVALFGSNLRDHQAAHYKLNHRFDDPFWDSARNASMPASFERRLETFRARALVTLQDEETFDEQSWSSLFLGCGVMPEGYDARLDLVPEEAHIGKVQARLREVALLAQQMPTVVEFSTQQPAAAQVQQ